MQPPTGSIASAHSPWPRCNSFTLSMSAKIWTKSPTANCWTLEAGSPEDVTAVLAADITLVNTAGLKVHLYKMNYSKTWKSNIIFTVKTQINSGELLFTPWLDHHKNMWNMILKTDAEGSSNMMQKSLVTFKRLRNENVADSKIIKVII